MKAKTNFRLTNTVKHIRIGTLFGVAISMAIAFMMLFDIAIFACIVFALGTIGWENAQRAKAMASHKANMEYVKDMKKEAERILAKTPKDEVLNIMSMKNQITELDKALSSQPTYNWADAIVDVIAGNVAFNVCFWIVMYFGGYFA